MFMGILFSVPYQKLHVNLEDDPIKQSPTIRKTEEICESDENEDLLIIRY